MKDNSPVKINCGGFSFISLLTVAFVVLKLIGEIDWPWIWVLSPLWIPIAILVAITILFAIFALIAKFALPRIELWYFMWRRNRWRKKMKKAEKA